MRTGLMSTPSPTPFPVSFRGSPAFAQRLSGSEDGAEGRSRRSEGREGWSATLGSLMPVRRIFLLSPASCGGERARLVFREQASFDIAERVRRPEGAPLGDVFSFLSGLYFRGKLTYARAFAAPPAGLPGVLVITTNRGLVLPEG